jgi:hypothetical protein
MKRMGAAPSMGDSIVIIGRQLRGAPKKNRQGSLAVGFGLQRD